MIDPKTFYRFDENYEVSDTVNATKGVYQNYYRLDPRLSIQYKLDSTSQVKGADSQTTGSSSLLHKNARIQSKCTPFILVIFLNM